MKKILLSVLLFSLLSALAWADVSHPIVTPIKHRTHQSQTKHHAHRAVKHHAKHRHYRSV